MSRALIVSATIVIALGAGIWFIGLRDKSPPAVSGIERETTAVETDSPSADDLNGEPARIGPSAVTPESASPAPVVNANASPPPLPDPDLPFALQLDALAERAAQGDATAACRLMLQGSKCLSQARSRNFAAAVQRSLSGNAATNQDELLVRAVAASEESGAKSPGNCEGVEVDRIPSPDSYLARAAATMSVRQKVALAMMRPDGSLSRLPRQPSTEIRTGRNSDYLVPQFLADNDLRFLQEGVAAADPLALEGLIQIHAPSRLPGSLEGMRISLPNPYQFAVHGVLMQRLFGPDILGLPVDDALARTLASMTPETLARLNQEVDARQQRWLAAGQGSIKDVDLSREPDDVAWCEDQ